MEHNSAADHLYYQSNNYNIDPTPFPVLNPYCPFKKNKDKSELTIPEATEEFLSSYLGSNQLNFETCKILLQWLCTCAPVLHSENSNDPLGTGNGQLEPPLEDDCLI